MNEQEFIKKLKKLQAIKPRADWKARNRTLLLNSIQEEHTLKHPYALDERQHAVYRARRAVSGLFSFILPTRTTMLMLRPAGIFLMLSFTLITSSILTVSASQDTIPGDTLYTVKITAENVRMALTFDEQEKAKLDIVYAEKRIDELEQIVLIPEVESVTLSQIEIVVDQFEDHITSAQDTLDDIVDESTIEEVVELAIIIEEKTTEFEDSIEKVSEGTADPVQDILDSAAEVADETSTASLGVLIKKQEEGTTDISLDSLSEKVDVKLIDLEQAINTVDEQIDVLVSATSTDVLQESEPVTEATSTDALTIVQDQNDTAEAVLEEAKDFITDNNLGDALIKISEGNDLVDTAEEQVQDIIGETIVEGISTDAAEDTIDNTTSTEDLSIKDSEEMNESEDGTTIPEPVETQ